jgi:Predicted membrane protein
MKPLFVLICVFAASLIGTRVFKRRFDYKLAGRIALAVMLLFTSMGHFVFTEGMTIMLPDFVPFRTELVYLTGIIEILAAAGMFIPRLRRITGILLMFFFVLVLPSNIYAAVKHVNYETGTFDGQGISYLWFRIPFQVLLIWWTYFFVMKR